MTPNQKHTPVQNALDKVCIMQKYNDSDKVLECKKEFEKAEQYIITATNNHEKLVEALKCCRMLNLHQYEEGTIGNKAHKAVEQTLKDLGE